MTFPRSLLVALLCLPCVVSAEALPVNRDLVWFKPSLAVNSSPVCEDLLRVEQETFFSASETRDYESMGFTKIRGMYEQPAADPRVEPVDASFRQLLLTLADGQRVFVYFRNNGGCGGGCETEQVFAADQVFDPPPSRGDDLPGSPHAAGWSLFKSAEGDFYAVGTVEHGVQAYRVASARLELACEVTISPARLYDYDDAAVRSAWQAVEAMLQVYGSMAQAGGYCGSLNAPYLRRKGIEEAMEQALYRPWVTRGWDAHPSEAGRPAFEDRLEAWSLTGVAESAAFARYLEQRERGVAEIGRLYRRKFGWPEAEAKVAAGRVIRAAFDRGFAFSSAFAPPAEEQALRRAILHRLPLSDIEQLRVNRGPGEDPLDHYRMYDSALNAAVEYPEALQYLLEQGLDPNAANGFGKTPLMYAAQYNQLESVRILLAAGADPNATTHIPADGCFYTLKTDLMTPLHYAARYASAPLIRLLVAKGATPSSQALDTYEGAHETPLDWLEKYTSDAATEKNPNIEASELPQLMGLLSVPSDAN